MKLKKNEADYFQYAVKELIDDKIDLHFSRTVKVDDCGGYFDPLNKELKVAIWNKYWFYIFIHEFNHYKQWKLKTKLWEAAEDIDFFNSYEARDVLPIQLMEQECDKMVLKDIKKWDLNGFENYIQESNSYHISYNNICNKKEFPKKGPFRFEEIVSLCPKDRFYKITELQHPKQKLYKLIDELCF
tara:strand:+ start:3005 stop:3562 length:558 start_codon:yes stop_codon:yes gene_type:complete